MGRDGSVGLATGCRLDGPWIESRWGQGFTHPSRLALGPTQSPIYNGYQVSLPGVKRPGRGGNYPPQCSAEVKERIELYVHFPSGSSWSVPGWTFLGEYGHRVILCTKQAC